MAVRCRCVARGPRRCDIGGVTPALLALTFGLAAPAWGGQREMYTRAVALVADRYLWPEQVDPALALREAAAFAEHEIPWLLVDAQGAKVVLRHGERGPLGTVELAGAEVAALAAALDRMEDLIRSAGEPLPDGVDLPVLLLRGMAVALDRHSVVLAASRLDRFEERISGRLSGVGARLGREGGVLVVQGVFADGPAVRAGLRDGDVVVAVDGVPTAGQTVDQVVRRIRGEAGTRVKVEVLRKSAGKPDARLSFDLVREDVVVPNVEWTLRPSGVGVVRIDHFSEQTARLVRQALDAFAAGPQPLRGVVLDLRGNTGGSMLQACRTADLFLQDGPVLLTQGRGGARVENLLREYKAHPEGVEPGVPVVVLQDTRSASASEILAGVLSLRGRALLMGERSHGKGTVQQLFTLRQAGEGAEPVSFKLTIAQYLLPGNTPVKAGVGLRPDLEVSRATFGRDGVALPAAPPGERAVVVVDERPGWRAGAAERPDPLPAIAERVVLAAGGADRAALLAAADKILGDVRREEERRLVETFRARGLDWAAAPSAGAAPTPAVRVSLEGPAAPGSAVVLRAEVTNPGPEPLFRAAVRLGAEDAGLPWDGVVLPVGLVPPGEARSGTATVRLPPGGSPREDLVSVTLSTDRRPALAADPVLLPLDGAEAPRLVVQARFDAVAGTLWLAFDNPGPVPLGALQVRLGVDPADGLSLGSDEAAFDAIPPGGRQEIELPLQAPAVATAVALDLRLALPELGVTWDWPLNVGADGMVRRLEAPVLTGRVPARAPVGRAAVSLRADDEAALRSLTVWFDGDKLAWRRGNGRSLGIDLSVPIEEGSRPLRVEAIDADGLRTARTWWVRGTAG